MPRLRCPRTVPLDPALSNAGLRGQVIERGLDGFSYGPATSTIDINRHNSAKGRKFRNIADNGCAAFVVDDLVSVRPWRVRCLEIRGVAETLSTVGGPLIRLHPKRIIPFGTDQPDTETAQSDDQ